MCATLTQETGHMEYPLPYTSVDLSGQTALVTGASSGLGYRFAKVLAACGAKVVLTARRVERLESLAEEIRGEGGEALPLRLDVNDDDNLMEVVAQTENALGPVTILVNNAGIPDAQRATRMSIEFIDLVIGTNLRAPYILSCEIARRLMDHKLPGRIVNLASAAAFRYDGNGAALYSITKAAVVRMTQALSVEWSRYHINVNCIAPGAFESEMMDGMQARIGELGPRMPRKRIGHPAQLDSTLLYLVSPASEVVTGAVLHVDDGQGAK